LERSAAQGHVDAIKLLNFLVEIGVDTSEVHGQEGNVLRQRAAAGDVEAQYQLALRNETGVWGVEQNNKEALRRFRNVADRGHVPAMLSLAHIYEQGLLSVTPNSKEAKRWRERAAAH
jgi:TPR repeat protein